MILRFGVKSLWLGVQELKGCCFHNVLYLVMDRHILLGFGVYFGGFSVTLCFTGAFCNSKVQSQRLDPKNRDTSPQLCRTLFSASAL